jgi:PKD repeat protein
MKLKRNDIWLLLVALGLILSALACGLKTKPMSGAKPFAVQKDTQLAGGDYTFSSVNIPGGVTVTATDDVTITVTGDTNIAGALIGDCVSIALQGQGNIILTGSIDNQCAKGVEDTKALIIQTDGGDLVIGTENKPATLNTSGLLDITNDPGLEEWEFDVLPDQRSTSPLSPVCSAQADTIAGSASPDVPGEVVFYGMGADPDGGPVTYTWDFGDGTSSTEREPFHTYTSWGVFDVSLTVTDDDDQTCQATLRVVMDDGGENQPDAPGVWVEPLDLVVETGQEAIFTSDALDLLGQDLAYHWDFGDGTTSSESEPFHTYMEAGRYPVTLTAAGPDGATSAASVSLYVYPAATADSSRSPGLAHPAPAPQAKRVEISAALLAGVGARGLWNGDVLLTTLLGPRRLTAGLGRTGDRNRPNGGMGGSVDFHATGNMTINTGSAITAGAGGVGFAAADRGGNGGRGGRVAIVAGRNLIIGSNSAITAGKGGSGGTPLETPFAIGGNGGNGGHVTIKAGGTLTIESGATIASGNGGPGGDAKTAAASLRAYARGGNGGDAGYLVVGGRRGIVFKNAGPPPVTVVGGDGGQGGEAIAQGKQGAGQCPRGGDGANAGAVGGNGGSGLGGFISRNIVYNVPVHVIGGNGGKGGNATAEAGAGGDVTCQKEAYGGKGGSAKAFGGRGGSASLGGGLQHKNLLIGGPGGADVFVGGKGGDATASSGRGGHATATGKACGDPAHAVGGDAGYAEASGGRGARGYKIPGDGGNVLAYPGHGGDATATGGKCGDGDCARKGGDARAIAGDGGNGLARGGTGGRGAQDGGAITAMNFGQGFGLGLGGTAKASGGKGGGCGAQDCPGGRGGNGGTATAEGGMGGLLRDSGGERRTSGGDAQATGGDGGRGAACCNPPAQGGNGGAGGNADASVKMEGVVLTELGGNGGQGGEGKPPGNGGAGGLPGGNKGDDGKPCLEPTPPPSPTSVSEEVAPPAPAAGEYVAECNTYLEQGKSLLAAHETGGCTQGIRLLRLAIEKSSTALELDPDNAEACFCRGMARRWLEEALDEAVQDLQCALDKGLGGDKRGEAERELVKLKERLAAPICVVMGPVIFAEDWNWEAGEPIHPGTTFSADSLTEIWARWTLSNPCGEEAVVKWYHDGEHVCQHSTGKLEGSYEGSGWTADEEWIEPGLWCMAVYIGDTKMTEGCFTVTDQPPAAPRSALPTILSIEFPGQIPADGTSVDGKCYFTSPNGLSQVSFDVISAVDFSSFAFDPRTALVEGDATKGAVQFHLWCTAAQDVTFRVTLYDVEGNGGSPYDFSFSCK